MTYGDIRSALHAKDLRATLKACEEAPEDLRMAAAEQAARTWGPIIAQIIEEDPVFASAWLNVDEHDAGIRYHGHLVFSPEYRGAEKVYHDAILDLIVKTPSKPNAKVPTELTTALSRCRPDGQLAGFVQDLHGGGITALRDVTSRALSWAAYLNPNAAIRFPLEVIIRATEEELYNWTSIHQRYGSPYVL